MFYSAVPGVIADTKMGTFFSKGEAYEPEGFGMDFKRRKAAENLYNGG